MFLAKAWIAEKSSSVRGMRKSGWKEDVESRACPPRVGGKLSSARFQESQVHGIGRLVKVAAGVKGTVRREESADIAASLISDYMPDCSRHSVLNH